MIKAFIFDLDGVITDTAAYHFTAWEKLADQIGITIDYAFNERLKGVSRMESLERILVYGGKQFAFTQEEKLELANEKNAHYQKSIKEITPSNILPGIKELLKEMKGFGYKLGLASASHNAVTVLQSLGLYEAFDVIADVAAVKQSKPAPDIFLLAANKLMVDVEHCIGIEDAASGIESILRAGMFAVGVGDKESLQAADYYVSSTDQLSIKGMISAWENQLKI